MPCKWAKRETMAGKTATAVAGKAKRVYHRARGLGAGLGGLGGGTFGPLIQGGLATLAGGALQGRVPYGGTLGIAGVGYVMGNPTLMTIAGMQLAGMIPNPLAGGTAGGAEGGEI